MEIVTTDEFKGWFFALDDKDAEAVVHLVGLLVSAGVTLRFPYSSAIQGSVIAMRELRVQSKGRPLRILYAFDPRRNAC